MATYSGKEQSSQSTGKVFQILEYLTDNRLPVRLQDLSEQLGTPQPTLLRYLNAMIKDNYVYQDEDTKRYALTWKICRLGHQIRSNLGIRSIVGPYLNSLSNELNLGSCLVTLDGYESIYVDLVEDPSDRTDTLQRIGKRAPLHTTGSGKIMLSTFTEYELDEYIREKGLVQLTENTITDVALLKEELEAARKLRYARDKQECEPDVQCISVPVYDYTDSVAAAISIFGHVSKTDDTHMKGKVLKKLFEVSREVSIRLGCSSSIWDTFKIP